MHEMISNKILKENELLFKQGDPSDGMFIIRKGSVKVYFENGMDKEVILDTLKAGSIVGEMSFFENKPRSACIKTIEPCDFTKITIDEYAKLEKPAPQWVFMVINAICQRLRKTNEKLQEIESSCAGAINPKDKNSTYSKILPHQKYPYEHALHVLKIVLLSLAKDGDKEGNEVSLLYDSPKEIWSDFYHEENDLFDKIISITLKTGFLDLKQNRFNQKILVFHNRGGFSNFITLFSEFSKKLPVNSPFISTNSISLLHVLIEHVEMLTRTNMIISIDSLIQSHAKKNADAKNWNIDVLELKKLPGIKVIHNEYDLSVVINTKECKQTLKYLNFIHLYYENNLA